MTTPLASKRTPSKASWSEFTGSTSSSSNNKSKGRTPTSITTIEKIVGFVSDKYDCVHNNFAGTLYAGPLAIVWLGRIFFFEWTVIVKWEDVAQVQKQSGGIRVIVRTPKPGIYEFEKLFNPEKAWANLVSLHNDTIMDKPRREPTPRQVSRSMRRRNSDPLRMSMMFNDGPQTILEESDSFSPKGESALRKKRELDMHRSVSVPMEKDLDTLNESVSHESVETSCSTIKVSLEKQWADVLDHSATYTETVIGKHEYPCSLDRFIELFIKDESEFPLPAFMQESGDEEIQCSPWEQRADGMLTRTIEYTHPVNAPMAPPMARARKEQSYRKYGRYGMILQSKTYVSDVPMTDCFYVADQILVEPVDDKVAITMAFHIKFVKSTMFEGFIARTARSEFHAFMQRWAGFISKSLGSASVAAPAAPVFIQPSPPSTALSILESKLKEVLLILIILLQIWILLDLRSMKADLRQLYSASEIVCPDSEMAP